MAVVASITTSRDRLFAMGAAALVAALAITTNAVSAFDGWLFDAGQRLSERAPSADVVVVEVDDASLARIGPWPWPRHLQARLIDRLAEGGASVIVDTLPFDLPEDARGLDEIRRLARLTETDLSLASHTGLLSQLQRSAAALDTDSQLAASIARTQNTILSTGASAAAVVSKEKRNPSPTSASQLATLTWPPGLTQVPLRDFRWPLPKLLKGASGVGHIAMTPDRDGVLRTHDLSLLTPAGRAVPSVVLAAVAQYRGARAVSQPLSVSPFETTLGAGLSIPTDGAGRMRPQYYSALSSGRAQNFRLPFYEVLSGAVPASAYRDKIVFIGAATAAVGSGTYTAFNTPVQRNLPQVEVLAQMTASLLSGHTILHPWWTPGATGVITALVLALLWWGLPRWSVIPRTLATVIMVVLPMAVAHSAMTQRGLWLPVALPVLMMLAGDIAIGIFHLLRRAAGHVQTVQQHDAELAQSLEGLSARLQMQGNTQAAAEVAAYINCLRRRESPYVAALEVENDQLTTQPMHLSLSVSSLGRYVLDEEWSRGAMGAIYTAHDPTIGRTVAIKTMSLSSEFEGEALRQVREQFLREAETAGSLQHADIVTIYDAGEERGLAYIAMELLRGPDLSTFVHPSKQLPVPQLLHIIARVADALAYAHGKGVVHRDVKPANVVVDFEHGLVKVTDFGIARVTDTHRTRTGILIGTPAFMSPEQLSGLPVDGRSDLYSLGVMLFQLLTGELPFQHDNIGELMHAVAHTRAPDIRLFRPELPEALANIVALALEKRPETRYANGRQMAEDLRAMAHLIEREGLPAVVEEQAAPINIDGHSELDLDLDAIAASSENSTLMNPNESKYVFKQI
jgi:serine/threonine-protein kinase